ncbi:MFS general substrate transporter [Pholiota conissans]|uniref:MFS general substrate transporter n=1 Tax=Pholiota conissans TaxID=109636 RepID=A0A9P5YIX5_9AGAR|nr:MFS general substrate transporter [Pholiota conissans]
MPFQLEKLGYTKVSSLAGWLLFAYSAGLAISTIPIAMLSERYNARKWPLIFGLLVLTGSQILLMEAPSYAVMCIARILQGFGSSVVWVVGLALLCDSAPPATVGLQLGFAMIGLSVGLVIGPAVGGALYTRFGYRGPFIFSIGTTVIDLLGRLIIIERKEALLWGVDPAGSVTGSAVLPSASPEIDTGCQSEKMETKAEEGVQISEFRDIVAPANNVQPESGPSHSRSSQTSIPRKNPISLLTVLAKLGTSSRTLVACFILFVYGLVYSSQEPSIPVHLQRVWGLNSATVGIVFIAAVVPTLFSSPLTGFLSDRYGPEWVTFCFLLFALPWWVVIIVEWRLALFISSFALEAFFTSGIMSPLSAELAAVSRTMEGVGFGHVYGALNLVYGIGSTLGPIVGGQIFDHVKRGWMVLCLVSTAMLSVSLVLASCFIGSDPLLYRLLRRCNASSHI